VINPREIVELPLNGREYADLTLLSPGVAKSPLENGTDSSRDGSFNVNGGRSELNNFLLDGIDNNAYGTSNQGFSNQVIQPNPDALQEFKVESDNYSAEFGRASGAVINANIKSGTNRFHGELWEFNRNTIFNAVGFFKPVGGGNLPFNQNQFGASLGGPILKDKMFLFADYEGFRRVSHPLQFATIPTAAMDQGNFSAYGLPISNPLNGQTFSNGIIPQSQYSPIANAVLQSLPAPNLPGLANNFESSPADTIFNDKGDIRYDAFVSPKLSVFARYSQFDTNIFSPPNIPGSAGGNSNGNVMILTKQAVAGTTWTISPSMILEARLGIDYTIGGKTPPTIGLSTPQFVIPGEPTGSLAGGLFTVSLSGFSQLGRQNSNPQYQDPFVGDPKVNLTKIVGRHTLKFGFEFQLIDTAVSDFHPQYGQENFTGFFSDPTYLTNPSSVNSLSNTAKEVYSLADFIFGAPSHYELDNNPVAHLRQRMYFAYLQDDFKVSSKLTLNLGMRYEFATPQYERNNQLANFDPVNDTLIYVQRQPVQSRPGPSRLQQLGAPARARLSGAAENGDPRRIRNQLCPIQPFRRRELTALQRPVHRGRRHRPARHAAHLRVGLASARFLLPLHGARLSRQLRLAAGLQPGYHAAALHSRRRPYRLCAELALHHPARARQEPDAGRRLRRQP